MIHESGIDLILDVGRELMECGAESAVVEECMGTLSHKLELSGVGITVLPKSILATIFEDGHHKTKICHIDDVKPDFRKLTEIYRLCRKDGISDPRIIRSGLSLALRLKEDSKIKFLTTPLALVGFAMIFGAGIAGTFLVFIAGFFAFLTKEILLHKNINVMLANVASAFCATFLIFSLSLIIPVSSLSIAQAASVLFLVPGVPLINSLEDLLKGHYLNGLARGMRAFFLTFGVVTGIILALALQEYIGRL
jgi:uncharacterized membrane protein YjjP (DUF1212 family)